MNAPTDTLSLPTLTREGGGQGRRSSWGGQEDPPAPEVSADEPISTRRSMVSIFGSLGKAGKHTERRKPNMTYGESSHRKVTNSGKSQFYVDLPDDTLPSSSPAPAALPPLPAFFISQPGHLTTSTTSHEVCQQQQQETEEGGVGGCVSPPANSPRRVLVIPEAAREALAYQQRALRLAQNSQSDPPEHTSMGQVGSTGQHSAGGAMHGGVEVCVAQRYGSVLAELVQKRNPHSHTLSPPPSIFSHILPSHTHPTASQTQHNSLSQTHASTAQAHPAPSPPQNIPRQTEHSPSQTRPALRPKPVFCNGVQVISTTTGLGSVAVPDPKCEGLVRCTKGDSQDTNADKRAASLVVAVVNETNVDSQSEGECSGDDDSGGGGGGDGDGVDKVDGESGEGESEGVSSTGKSEGDGEESVISSRNSTVTLCDLTNTTSEPANSDLSTNTTRGSSSSSNNNNSMMLGVTSETNLCPSDVTPGASPELTSQEKRDRKVFLIAQEIMTSEQVFVDVLRLLNIDFRRYVMEGGVRDDGNEDPMPALPTKDLDRILNYLPQLQNLNEEILSDLERSIQDWEGRRKISDVIVRKGPFLKLYSDYIREFQSQCDHLDHCCTLYPAFSRVVKQFEASERCTKLGVKHYMLKPVQRIPQYRLLLEQYLRTLPQDSPDYLDTQDALVVVANVASHANTTLKHGTNFMKLLQLQDRLSSSTNTTNTYHADHQNNNTTTTTHVHNTNGTSSTPTTTTTTATDNHNPNTCSSGGSRGPRYELVRPGRYLLKEGELMKLCRREMQPRYFILLSDVLLYTSQVTGGSGGALRLNYELTLEGMRVEVPQADDFKNEFSVISTSRSFTLQASSAKERDEWLTALREAIADNAFRRSSFLQAKIPDYPMPTSSTLGKQAPVWIPDYRVTMCQQCTAAFTLTFRRHHCRACGKVVCDHCSSNRAPLQYKGYQVARVCDGCFEVLQRDFQMRCEAEQQAKEAGQGAAARYNKDNLKAQFKRGIRESNRKTRKRVPDRLVEVCASDESSQMRGYLRVLLRRSWRRGWFVLKDRVLYEYRAPQDVKALYSLPVLGYLVLPMDKQVKEVTEDLDNCLAFQLSHPNQEPLLFQADSPHLAEKWIQAMKEAVVLT